MPDYAAIRTMLAKAVLERADTLGMKRREMEKIAKNMFLGASHLAKALNEEALSNELKQSYTIIVERNGGLVYKWAGILEPEIEKEAA